MAVTLLGEFEIRRKISLIADSSRVSRTTSVSWPEAEELLWRTAFRVFALRLGALASLLLALERRRIAIPRLSTTPIFKVDYSRDLRSAKWVSIKLRCKTNRPCPLWVKSGHRSTSA